MNDRNKKPIVFLSTGFHQKSEEEVRKAIADATTSIHELIGPDVIVVHNYDCHAPDKSYKHPRLYYLGEAVKKMADVSYIYFDNGWYLHKGCIVEMMIAHIYGLKILENRAALDDLFERGIFRNICAIKEILIGGKIKDRNS